MPNILFLIKSYFAQILFLICVIGVFVIGFYFLNENNNHNNQDLAYINNNLENKEVSENQDNLSNLPEKFYVDLKGAVKNPGVYQVEDTSIIQDVINLAGGFRSDAYQNNINLSKKVSKEMVIYIYTKSEIAKETNTTILNSTKECSTPTYIISECVKEKAPIIEVGINSNYKDNNTSTKPIETPDNSENNSSNTSLININLATEEELSKLNGIGSSKAKKIIEYRTTNGKFQDIIDIMKVSGIGETIFAKIKSFITI